MVKFYFDEDSSPHRLIAALRSRGLDVETSLEAAMNSRDDEPQLIFATERGRVLVSANASDFATLHGAWSEQGRLHCGILIIPQQRYSTGEIVRRLLRLVSSGLGLENGIYYLSNF